MTECCDTCYCSIEQHELNDDGTRGKCTNGNDSQFGCIRSCTEFKWKTSFTDNPICPFCGTGNSADDWESDRKSSICTQCDHKYTVEIEYTPHYTTDKWYVHLYVPSRHRSTHKYDCCNEWISSSRGIYTSDPEQVTCPNHSTPSPQKEAGK